jgi:hypothetical protein
MSKVFIPSAFALFIYKPINPTNTNAEPAINMRASFIALYSFFPLPQIPINKNLGITANSKKKNKVNKSSDIKNP